MPPAARDALDSLPHRHLSVMNEHCMGGVSNSRTLVSLGASRPSFDGAPTTIDADAVQRVRDTPIPVGTKGLPWRAGEMTPAELGATRWAALDGSFPMPLMILRESAL